MEEKPKHTSITAAHSPNRVESISKNLHAQLSPTSNIFKPKSSNHKHSLSSTSYPKTSLFSKLARTARKVDNTLVVGKKNEPSANPFQRGHKRVKSDIPSSFGKEKLGVTGNMTSMNKLLSNQHSKVFSKNMKITGNSYVLSTSKDEQVMISSNKSSSSKLKTI